MTSPRRRAALRVAQRRLERFYGLEELPDVTDFVRVSEAGARETLLLRETEQGLEVALVLPPEAEPGSIDELMQLIEGVSHFVLLAERARTELPATRLELELQAEVDKFVVLAFGETGLDRAEARELHSRLYEDVRYVHPSGTERGDRYRLANDLAAKLTARLMSNELPAAARVHLRRFYRAGQADKIRLALAA